MVMWCVSIDNSIGDEGASALSQCLPHLTQLTHLYLSGECVHWCVTWCVMCVTCDVWVQTTRLEIKGQVRWVSAWHTWHNSHTLTWVVSVRILMCYLVCNVAWCVMCVSTANRIGNEGAKALSQCSTRLIQITHLDLSRECVHIDVLLRVCVCVCVRERDVCDVWVQIATLEMREQMHWVGA